MFSVLLKPGIGTLCIRAGVLAFWLGWSASTALGATTFTELEGFLPSDANALIVIDAEAMFSSPLGQKAQWRAHAAQGFESAALAIPPRAERCLFAAQLDLHTMQPRWELAAMRLSVDPSMADVARRIGGELDRIDEVDALWRDNAFCVAKLAPHTFGLLWPATRPEVARWLRMTQSRDAPARSLYLSEATRLADSGAAELLLAIDLDHALRPSHVRAAVEASELFRDIPLDAAVTSLMRLKGVTLGVRVTERLEGTLQFDFADDVRVLQPIAKPLILAVLEKAGAILPEFADWEATSGINQLGLRGELSADGLYRILSLLALDGAAMERTAAGPQGVDAPVASTGPRGGAPRDPALLATQRYFRSLRRVMQDLERIGRAGSVVQASMWLENYARRIDSLSPRNVDSELLQYAAHVSNTLRVLVDEAHGLERRATEAWQPPRPVDVQVGAVPAPRFPVNYGGILVRRYVPYGFAKFDLAERENQRQQSAAEIEDRVAAARTTIDQLLRDFQGVRDRLTQRFGVTFQ